MARFSADGQDYTRALALGTQANLTVCCWFKISVDRNDYSTLFSIDNGTGDNWLVQAGADGTTVATVFDATTQQGIGSVTTGVWYWLMLTTVGTTGNIYYRTDGQPGLTTVAVSGATASVNAATLRLGESPWGAEWLNGCLNAVKVWNRGGFTLAEAFVESCQYAPASTQNLVAYYPLQRPEVLDCSGRGQTLAGSGATYEDGPPIPWRLTTQKPFLVSPPTGGTTYPVSVSGGVTPAGGVTRQANHLTSGSVTPAAVAAKQTQRTLTGSATPTGLVVKHLARVLTGSVTQAGTLATIRTRLLTLAGSITPAAALVRQTSKLAAGSSSPAGAISKQTGKHPSGTISGSGVVTSIRTRLLAVAGAITPSGLLVRQPGKAAGGAASPSGSVTRTLARQLTGTATPAGVLSTARTRLLALAGAIAPSGGVVKRVGSLRAGAVTPAGALRRVTRRGFAGGIDPAGVVLKLVGRILAGDISPSGSVAVDTNIAPTVTPPERVLTVPAEFRTLEVPAESRVLAVPAESRTLEA